MWCFVEIHSGELKNEFALCLWFLCYIVWCVSVHSHQSSNHMASEKYICCVSWWSYSFGIGPILWTTKNESVCVCVGECERDWKRTNSRQANHLLIMLTHTHKRAQFAAARNIFDSNITTKPFVICEHEWNGHVICRDGKPLTWPISLSPIYCCWKLNRNASEQEDEVEKSMLIKYNSLEWQVAISHHIKVLDWCYISNRVSVELHKLRREWKAFSAPASSKNDWECTKQEKRILSKSANNWRRTIYVWYYFWSGMREGTKREWMTTYLFHSYLVQGNRRTNSK